MCMCRYKHGNINKQYVIYQSGHAWLASCQRVSVWVVPVQRPAPVNRAINHSAAETEPQTQSHSHHIALVCWPGHCLKPGKKIFIIANSCQNGRSLKQMSDNVSGWPNNKQQ